jgi:hypothetical protein
MSVFDRYIAQNKMWHFEGESGVQKLTKIAEDLGYGRGFMFGRALEDFLQDNPGACTAIAEFVAEWVERNDEWEERLADTLEPLDEADE